MKVLKKLIIKKKKSIFYPHPTDFWLLESTPHLFTCDTLLHTLHPDFKSNNLHSAYMPEM